MINNEHDQMLVKRLNQIHKEHLAHNFGVKDGRYSGTTEPNYGGAEFPEEQQEDIDRSRIMESFGAGKSTTVYKKQLPKLDGSGKPNMEMATPDTLGVDETNPAIKRGKRIPKNTFGRIQQSILSGGSKEEKQDLVDVILNKLMSGKSPKKKEKEEIVAELSGSGWNHAIKDMQKSEEVSGGAKPKPKKKDIILGRGTTEEISGGAKVDKRKSRAVAIKKIMAEKGMKMIEASKYIKANNISY